MRRDELVNRFWPPATLIIEAHRRRVFQKGLRDFPEPLYTLGGGKQRVIATHGVEDQALVRLEHFAVGRAQALLLVLQRLRNAGELPLDVPIWLDSPMAEQATAPRWRRCRPPS